MLHILLYTAPTELVFTARVSLSERQWTGRISKRQAAPSTSCLVANTGLLKPTCSNKFFMERQPSLQSLCITTSPVYTATPHYLHRGGSPILCRWWFTQWSISFLKNEPLCNSHRKLALRLLKKRDGTRQDDDVGVFSRCFPGVPLSI